MIISTVLAALPATAYAEYLNLSYRPDLRMVVLRWLRDTSLSELQLGHQAALHLARQQAAAHWFVDVRRLVVTNSSHSGWVIDSFLPQAAALLAEPLRIAYLMSPNRQNAIATQPDLRTVISRSQVSGCPYSLRIFLEEASAMTWLFEA